MRGLAGSRNFPMGKTLLTHMAQHTSAWWAMVAASMDSLPRCPGTGNLCWATIIRRL